MSVRHSRIFPLEEKGVLKSLFPAQIPVKNNPQANEAAFTQVRADEEREVHAHTDLMPMAKEVFDRMPQPNQLGRLREDVKVSRDDLLSLHEGTEDGFRLNIRVGAEYIEAWLRARGAVLIYNLMEDAATAEISRAQIWQWIQGGARRSTSKCTGTSPRSASSCPSRPTS